MTRLRNENKIRYGLLQFLAKLAWIGALMSCALSLCAFTPMVPLPAPRLLNLPSGIPGGNFGMSNLIDGKLKTEFASRDEGTNTVVQFDFAPAPRSASP